MGKLSIIARVGISSMVIVSAIRVLAADPVVQNVTAQQRYPWNGKVDVSFEVVGDLTAGLPEGTEPVFSLSATDRMTGSNYVAQAVALSGNMGTAEGLHHVVWDLNADGIEFKSEDVVFLVAYEEPQYLYCVIDVSAGANATTYPVSYLSDVPEGGWTDEYKTTKLVLRRIEPGEIPTHDACITKPFYIGVFEVTQKQYELVTGSNPSYYKGDMRPVERVTWNAIRGNSGTYNWPSVADVDSNSFMGRLRSRTNLEFDLPTEARWEYACRAGTTSSYNNGGNAEDDLKTLGRYSGNKSDAKGGYSEHTIVGSYLPNAWGLYDMHGNVWEWCLDWYGGSLSGNDPIGASSGSLRVDRGGAWDGGADDCTSSYRSNCYPSYAYSRDGFRIARTLSESAGDGGICAGESEAVSVDSRSEPIADMVTISLDSSWVGGNKKAMVVIADNGVEIIRLRGVCEFEHELSGVGRHELTYTTYIGDVAQDEIYTAVVFKDWKYEVRDGGAVIVDTVYKIGDVVIPSEIDGYSVIGIDGAFIGCNGMTSVVIPESVAQVGFVTFDGCTGLTNIVIESDVAFISYQQGLKQAKFNTRFDIVSTLDDSDEVSDVSGVIAAYQKVTASPWQFTDPATGAAYAWNEQNSTFAYFGEMYMEAGKTYVFGAHFDDDAYVKVDGQVLINIQNSSPYSVHTGSCLCTTTGWHEVEFRLGDNTGGKGSWGYSWSVDFGLGYRDDGGTSTTQSGWKKLVDPGDGSLFCSGREVMFGNCPNLRSITIPWKSAMQMRRMFPDSYDKQETMTLIGEPVEIPDNAFEGCAALRSIEIPSTVTKIGAFAFAGCSSLTEVVIPKGVWDVGEGAFANCTGLRRVEAAKGLQSAIESRGVFDGCSEDLEIVYISPEIHNVTARQRNPWGKVEVSFEVEGGLTAGLPEGTEPVFSLSATDRMTGLNYVSSASALSGDMGAAEGLHHVVWDLNADGVVFKSDDVVLSVAYKSQDQDLICIGDSDAVIVDSRVGPVLDVATLTWDASWVGGYASATVVIADNGTEVKRTTGAGEFDYAPSDIGRHELTYTTYIDGAAQDEVYTTTVFKEWKYEVEDGGAVIIGTTQTSGVVEIPSEIDGFTVSGIAAFAFANCSNLTEVTISRGVWDIGEGAFANCTALRRVEVAKALKSQIESRGVFVGCPDDMEIVYASPEIRNVVATPRNPWGKVEVSFEVEGDLSVGLPPGAQLALSLSATDRKTRLSYVANASALSGDTGTAEGAHRVVWDMKAQGLDFVSDEVVFTVTYGCPPKYCVIDLSAGANATTYPVSYLSDVPAGGWTDEYKTTKLVLRLIEPGSFKMCGEYDVTITKPYYIGVFEVTQKQYELVTGSNPSQYKGEMRPVEEVSWNRVRGDSSTYNWPNTTDVDPNSFAGRIQTRTGINFDLPTEAQWEYACRAGTTSAYNNGGNTENDLRLLGRYYLNKSDGKGGYSQHTTVGSYLPNAWGLYDMHGNAWEWCLGWYGGSLSGNDPVGPSSGSSRVIRGGGWDGGAEYSRLSNRYGDDPSHAVSSRGFRLARTLPESAAGNEMMPGDGEICSGDSASVALDLRTEPLVDSMAVMWDSSWVGGDANATIVIADNGTEVKRTTGAGEFEYTPSGIGRHELTYTTYIDGVAQDEVYTAMVFKEWKYEVEDGGAVITGTTHAEAGVGISPEIDGYPVTGIKGEFSRVLPVMDSPIGYSFGWFTAKVGGELVTSETTVAADMTLYARWTADKYLVTFDAAGGEGGWSESMDYGAEIVAPTVTRNGFVFEGWTPEVAATVPAGDVTYTARWTEIQDPAGPDSPVVPQVSLGDPFCFVDPDEADGYAELCNGSDWIDCWADGEDWAAVPINGADTGDELVPVIVYGSADASMVSDIHIEDEATFKARLDGAEDMEYDVEDTSRTDPDEIRSFVSSRRWLMVKINRIEGEFEPKTIFVGLKGCSEYRKFVIVWEDSDGADESRIEHIPPVAVDVTPEAVTNAIDAAGFADAEVKAAIGGSAVEYNAFKAWADGVKNTAGSANAGEPAGAAAVVASPHAAAAYLLGAERLFANEPTVEIAEVALGERSSGTLAPTMTVAVTVKDGESAVAVNADKVAAMFEATGDLGDWNGAAKLTPTVTTSGTDASGKMTFTVIPGDGTAAKAFLRIKR